MLPATVVLTPLFIAFNQLNILNTYIGPILTGATLGVPFSVLMLRTFFLGIPKDLEDAAKIDGCSRFTAFIRIILPISVPGIADVQLIKGDKQRSQNNGGRQHLRDEKQ